MVTVVSQNVRGIRQIPLMLGLPADRLTIPISKMGGEFTVEMREMREKLPRGKFSSKQFFRFYIGLKWF